MRKKSPGNVKDRRKTPRSSKTSKTASKAVKKATIEKCIQCRKNIAQEDRALFVEEDVGRIFCSEDCITEYFQPEIVALEKEYFSKLSDQDLSPDDREKLAHLRWVTLQEPDEIYRTRSKSGHYRYTLISEFQPGNQKVWCVCICLFLREEPSFLFIAFPTADAELAQFYRKGEEVERVALDATGAEQSAVADDGSPVQDGLADDWTEADSYRAENHQKRKKSDILPEKFAQYEKCLAETLEAPTEVWCAEMKETKVYSFIREYAQTEEKDAFWFVVLAKETEEVDPETQEEQLELLDAFPTNDGAFVQSYRKGEKTVSNNDSEESDSHYTVH